MRSKLFPKLLCCLGLLAAPMLAQYCTPTFTILSCDEEIQNVTMGSINNTHTCPPGGYADYTGLSTTITQGAPTAIVVTIKDFYTGDQVRVFVDWNNDFDWLDTNETFILSLDAGGTPAGCGGPPCIRTFSGTVTAPAGAMPTARMRVRLNYTGIFAACGSTSYGAVDDYTLVILPGSTPPTGVGSAAPSNPTAGGNTLLTVATTPGTSPPSTGITVTGDLSAIGGSGSQTFYDDASHGDVTGGDGTFSYDATIPGGQPSGALSLPFTVADLEGRFSSGSISLSVVPSNDECVNAIALVAGVNPASGFFSNDGATNSAGMGNGCEFANVGFADVFFTYTPPCSNNVTIMTCTPAGHTPGTNGDTHVDIYLASACPTAPATVVACDDDSGCGLPGLSGYLSNVTFAATGGQQYLIRVANYDYGAPNATYHPGTFYITVTPHTASFSTVGPGCTDGGGPGPSLTIDAPPVLGSFRTLTIASAAPGAPGLLFFSNPAAGPSPLTGGCNLYLDQGSLILLSFVVTDGSGGWSLSANAPASPAAECLAVTVQAILFPSGGGPFYQVTDGLGLVLGY